MIDVEDKGRVLVVALVGSDNTIFEIRALASGEVRYYVSSVWVTPEVYVDALWTAHNNTYCHDCNGVHDRHTGEVRSGDEDESDEVTS